MLIYLDSNIVIYAVENPAVFGARALARLQAISQQDRIAVSALTRMECCSHPLRHANFPLLRLYDSFFARSDVSLLPMVDRVFQSATVIQAMHNFGTVDSIHLAVALENGCQIYLTHDQRLASFTGLNVEVLA